MVLLRRLLGRKAAIRTRTPGWNDVAGRSRRCGPRSG
jgi:hypothetical protein